MAHLITLPPQCITSDFPTPPVLQQRLQNIPIYSITDDPVTFETNDGQDYLVKFTIAQSARYFKIVSKMIEDRGIFNYHTNLTPLHYMMAQHVDAGIFPINCRRRPSHVILWNCGGRHQVEHILQHVDEIVNFHNPDILIITSTHEPLTQRMEERFLGMDFNGMVSTTTAGICGRGGIWMFWDADRVLQGTVSASNNDVEVIFRDFMEWASEDGYPQTYPF